MSVGEMSGGLRVHSSESNQLSLTSPLNQTLHVAKSTILSTFSRSRIFSAILFIINLTLQLTLCSYWQQNSLLFGNKFKQLKTQGSTCAVPIKIKKYWIPLHTGYRENLRNWVPLGTGYQENLRNWVPGTEQILEVGYRWVPGTEQILEVGYRWVPGTEQIYVDPWLQQYHKIKIFVKPWKSSKIRVCIQRDAIFR